MKKINGLCLHAVLAGVLTSAAWAAPTTYQLNARSVVDLRVFKDGIAAGLAHDHVIRATAVTGTVVYDPETKRLERAQVEVDAQHLDVDPGRIRALYNMDGELDADDRAQVAKNMRAADQLDVAHYPKMTFESGTIGTAPDGRILLAGRLTLRGKTRDVQLPVAIWANADRLEGKGTLTIRHTDFGFQPYEAMGGAIRNQDRIDLIITLRATAVPPAAGPPAAGPPATVPPAPAAPASADPPRVE